jgi:hypothetical protein
VALILSVAGAATLARVRGGVGYAARWLMVGLIVACAMLFPIHESFSLVGSNSADSLGFPTETPQNVAALSRYLAPRTGTLRYELAVDDPTMLAPLIIHDRRPILPLTSFGGTRLTGVTGLLQAINSGKVLYGLLSNARCTPPVIHPAACTAAAQWIRQYGVNVSAQAGLTGPSKLYLLAPGAAR